MLDVIELAAIVLVNGLVDCLLVAWIAGKRSKEALVAYLESPESDEMFDNVFKRFWTRLNDKSIKTGAVIEIKDENGTVTESHPETISPLDNIVREFTRFVMLKINAAQGGKAKAFKEAVQQAAQDPNNPGASSLQGLLAMAGAGSRKGLDLESLLIALVSKYLFKDNTGGSGGSGGGAGW